MGQIKGDIKSKYKDILEAREMIEGALDFEKKLKGMMGHLKEFDSELHPFKNKEQKKIKA